MDTGVSSEFIAALNEEIERHVNAVVHGSCSSYDSYKYKVGYIQGLQAAERMLHETIELLLKAQDLDDEDD